MIPSAPLSGLRVLDLTNLLAAPQVAALLGDFGADVVKIEPRGGDPLRRIGLQRDGGSPQWALVSRNKRAITLDLDHAEGQRVFDGLVRRADVLVENLTPALLGRWRCEPDSLLERNPRLVVVSISCYGRNGPYSDRPGAGALAEAFGGFAHMNGEADGPPLLPSIPLGDMLSGFSGMIGALVACYARDRVEGGSGRGQHVDVSLYEPILQLLALPLAIHDGKGPPPKRSGSRVEGGVPRNLYRCRDGHWIALSGTTDAQVARVLETIGRSSEEDRARYGTSPARLRVADELDGLVAAWIAEHDRETTLRAFHEARIPVAPVNDLAAILDDPHVRARASIDSLADPELGRVSLVVPTPRLSETPGAHRNTGPPLGAHNAEVFREWLGIDEGEIEALERCQAI
ncbi:MAG: CoA transferase [Deltaproteobacteria bacterium]|jgi:crotonobetainyl-CoA:carnitine CoA-transferase CaiB-like acyl-CoA transferase|nr:CoA transferase [Deltaproteobacteria bacterium]MBW2500035.1 CoA transferase [Deltaproteobacteria bacterium]